MLRGVLFLRRSGPRSLGVPFQAPPPAPEVLFCLVLNSKGARQLLSKGLGCLGPGFFTCAYFASQNALLLRPMAGSLPPSSRFSFPLMSGAIRHSRFVFPWAQKSAPSWLRFIPHRDLCTPFFPIRILSPPGPLYFGNRAFCAASFPFRF